VFPIKKPDSWSYSTGPPQPVGTTNPSSRPESLRPPSGRRRTRRRLCAPSAFINRQAGNNETGHRWLRELSLDGLKLALVVQIFYTTTVPDYYRAFQRFAFAC
jgi:hypothetical protein